MAEPRLMRTAPAAVSSATAGAPGQAITATGSGPAARSAIPARSARPGTNRLSAPSDQATPALVVAIAFAPAAAIATAEATSQAFASSSGSPARCRLAKSSAWRACPVVKCVVMPITLARSAPVSWPHPDVNDGGCGLVPPVRPGVVAHSPVRGTSWLSDSERDDQLVVDLGELDDLVRELAGDQVAVGRRAGVRVVGGLIGEVLDEQQVVRLGRVPVHPERQGTVLGPRVQQQGSTRGQRRVWPDPDTMIGGTGPDPASESPDR